MTSQTIYREKPKEVEARLFDGDQDVLAGVLDWVQNNGYSWFDMFTPGPARGVSVQPSTGFLYLLDSKQQPSTVQKGDWVILKPDGDFKRMSASEFAATYEEVTAS